MPLKAHQGFARLSDRMGGAKLLFLLDHFDGHIVGQRGIAHRLGTVTGHNNRTFGGQYGTRFQRMDQHRFARNGVEDLGQVRVHPGAFACRKNDQGGIHAHSFLSASWLLFTRLSQRRKTAAHQTRLRVATCTGGVLPIGRRCPKEECAVKTVVFDLDGTLADTSGDLIAAANVCFQRMGAGDMLDPAADAGTALRGGRAMLTLGLSRLGRAGDTDAIDAYYPVLLEAYAQDIDRHTFLYPGAMDAVEALKLAGFGVAICTNKPEGLAETLMQRLGVRDAFAALVGADTLPVRKPNPEPLFESARRAGGHPDKCVLIGDSDTDRNTARAAGVPSVLVTFGPAGGDMAALEPEALLHDYADLPGIVVDLIGEAAA